MKHYPITVANTKASACVELSWNKASISIKIPHRKAQKIGMKIMPESKISSTVVENYPTYTAVRFLVDTKDFFDVKEAIKYCKNSIKEIWKYINFEASSELVIKELCRAL